MQDDTSSEFFVPFISYFCCLVFGQINLIDVNFHLQKSLEIVDKNSPDKIWSKKYNGMESALPHAN